MKSRCIVLLAALILGAVSVFSLTPSASAQTYQWDPGMTLLGSDSSGNWDTTSGIWAYNDADTTWTDGSIAQFGYGTAGSYTVNLVANVNPLGVILGSNGLDSYSITGSNTLTIGASGLTVNTSGAISAPVALGAAQAWTTATGQTLTIGGAVANGGNLLTFAGAGNDTISSVISGSGGLTVSGPGLVALNNNNTYTGDTNVNGGTLELNAGGNPGALGTGNNVYVNNGGTLFLNRTDALSYVANAANLNVTSGGLVVANSGVRITLWNAVSMTGGTLAAAGAGLTDGSVYFPTNYSLCGPLNATSDLAGNPATISATIGLQTQSGNSSVVLNVTRGPGAVDLNVTGQIGTWNNTTSLTIQGGGVTQLAAANVYLGGTTINGSSTVITGGNGFGVGTLNIASGSVSVTAPAAPTGIVSQYYNLNPTNYYGAAYQSVQGNNALLDTLTPSLVAMTMSGAGGAAGTDQKTLFDFGSSANGPTTFAGPYAGTGATNFYVRYTGEIDIPTSGIYTFYTTSDDGNLLGIDGNTVVMSNYPQGMTTRSGTVSLTAGMHAFTTIYNQGGGGYGLNASISGPGISQEEIPASMFQTGALYLGGLQGGGQIDMAGNGISVGWNDANTTFSGNIIDSTGSTTATLLKAGQGALMLTGVNTYAGLTTVAGGTLAAANPSSLPGYGTSSISVAGGATLAVQSGDGTTGFSSSQIDSILANTNWASAYTSSSNVPFLGIDTTNGDFTYGTNITQNIGLSKFGPHTLYLTGANTYPGGTTINAGVLNINGDTALGAASGAIAFTGNSTLQAGNEGIVVNSARTVTINSGVTGTIDTASYNNFTIAAPIGGTGNLAKIGAGTLTLSASGVNSYSGATQLLNGTIAVNVNLQGLYEGLVSNSTGQDTTDAIPHTSIQSVARWGADTTTGSTNNVYPNWGNNTTWGYAGYIDNTTNHPITYSFGKNFDDNAYLTIDGQSIISNTTWNQNVTGQITLAPGLHTVDLRFGQGGGGVGPNTGAYDNYGVSYNTVGNTNTGGNWYQMGATDPSGDTQFYAAVAGMPNSQVVMSANTTLDLSAAGVGVAGVGSLADAAGSPTGALVLLGSNTLVTGLDNTNTSFSGTISGNGSLVKQGTGMFILAGSNTYTGTTSVVAGILDATSTAALPGYASAGTVGVMGGATLAVQANVNGTTGWTSSQIDALWGNASWASSTAALGIDTTQGDFTYGTNITGAFGLTKLGANALILTGANTYPGPTTVSAGTLQIGNGGSGESLNGTSGVGLAANTTLVFAQADTLTIAAPISGAGSLVQSAAGTTVLAASNSYTGSTAINAGVLSLGATGALGSTNSITFGGGTLQYTANNTTDYSAIIKNSSGAVSIDTGGQAVTFANALTASNSGGLFKTGAGTLTLSANPAYSGATTVNAGTLFVGGGALGTEQLTVNGGASLQAVAGSGNSGLAGLYYALGDNNMPSTNNFASLTALQSHIGTLGTPTTTLVTPLLNLNHGGANFPAPIVNQNGAQWFEGYYSGMLDISSTGGGTYTFQTGSDDGSMVWIDGQMVVNNNAFQGFGYPQKSGTISLTPGMHNIVVGYYQGTGGYALEAGISGPDTTGGTVDLGAAGSPAITPDLVVSSLSGAGNVNLQTGNLITGYDNSNTTFSGSVTSSGLAAGFAGLTKIGSGNLTVTGSLVYGGPTNMVGGTLLLGDGTGGHDPTVTTSGLALNNGSSVIYNVAAAQTAAYPISGAGSLTKTGPGTLTVTGTASSYSGATTISNGALQLGDGANNIGSLPGVITDNASLVFANPVAQTYGGIVAGSGAFTMAGPGSLTLTQNHTYAGPTNVVGGTLVLGTGGATLATTNISVGGAPSPLGSYSLGAGSLSITGGGGDFWGGTEQGFYLYKAVPINQNFDVAVNIAGMSGGDGSWAKAGIMARADASNNNVDTIFNAETTGSAVSAQWTNTSQNYQAGSSVGPNWLRMVYNASADSFACYESPSTSPTAPAAGDPSWVLIQTYSGITFDAGATTFDLGIADTSHNNGTPDTATFSNVSNLFSSLNVLPVTTALNVAAGGSVDLNGGSQQIVALSDYTPGNSGSIINSNALGATLTISPTGGASSTFSGSIGGSNGLTGINLVLNGNGTQVLTGVNTYTGSTTVTSGTLQLGDGTPPHDGSMATSNMIVGSTLLYNVGGTQMAAYAISGSGSVVKAGPGTLVVTNANGNFDGQATVSSGVLQLGDGVANNGSLQNIVNNASVVFANPTNQTYGGAISGNGTLTKTVNSVLTITGSNTYTGPTVVSGGTLQLGSAPSGVVDFYPLTSNANDIVGGANGTLNGSIAFGTVAGRTGVYLPGDGSSNVAMGALSSMTNSTQARTISGWVYVASAPAAWNSNYFGFYNTSNGNHNSMLYFDNNGTGPVLTSFFNDSSPMMTTAASVGTWSLFTATWDGTDAPTIYLNGQSLGSLGLVGGQNVLDNFGIDVGRSGFQGYVSDLSVFNTALTASQVAQLYANGGSALPSTLPASTTVMLGAASGAPTLDLNGASQQVVGLSDNAGYTNGAVINSNQAMPVTLTLAPAGATTFTGTISDNGSANSISLVVNGAGTQVLAGTNNTYSGATTVTAGTLAFTTIANADGVTPSSLGMPSASSGTISLGNPVADTNGYLQFIGSASCSSNRTIVMSNDSYIDASGANGAVLTLTGTTGSPAIYSVGGSGITLTGTGKGVVSGTISDDGQGGDLNKNGTGTWVLSSPNSYSGSTNVNAGVLVAGVVGALPTTTDVTVNGGTLDATAAAQTVNSLTMTGGALNLAIGNLFTASSTASLTGTLDVFGTSSTSEELMAFPGGYTGTFANAIIPSGFTLSYQANQLDLVAAFVGPPTWQAGSGNWSAGGNWTGGAAPNGATSTAVVNAPVGNSTVTITLDAPVTLGTLQLGNSTGTGGYTISGNATDNLTFDNGTGTAVLSASDGTHTLATPITLNSSLSVSPSAGALIAISGNIGQGPGVPASLTLANSGELVLSGSDSYQGGTIVDNGKLVFTSSAAVPASGALIVGAGGIVAFDPSVTAGAVEMVSSQQIMTAAPMVTAEVAAMAGTAHAAGGAVEAVPEPGTLALLLAALGGALVWAPVWAPGVVRSRIARRK